MNKYISTILIFFVIILFSSCGNNQAEEDITDTVGNVSEGGQCETDAECADELICDNNECVDSDGDSLPPPPPNSTCYIGGTLTLPDSVDATGVPYKVAIDTDTEFNLDEVTSTAENWSSGNIQEYTISIDDISQGSYYIYAMLSVGDENYIGYFGEIDANSPPDANASISCNAVFDITLEATTIDIPDIIIPKRAIAVGSAGEILYSDDFGVTWYLANSGTNSILRAASQGAAGRWVVVGRAGLGSLDR